MPEVYNPIQDKKRIVIMDILRGWALLGVVLMNYNDIYFFLGQTPHPGSFDKVLIEIGKIVFESKSWTMLSFLFGYGFAILIENVASKGISPVPFFTRRMFWLFMIAVVNTSIWFGDILKDYAVLGLLLLLFYKCSAKTILWISLALLLINPLCLGFTATDRGWYAPAMKYFALYHSHNLLNVLQSGLFSTFYFDVVNKLYLITLHETIFLCFLMGLAAQKINFFGRLEENKKYIKRIFWGSLGVAVFLNIFLSVVHDNFRHSGLANVLKVYDLKLFPRLSTMAFIVSAICWLLLSGKLHRFFSLLQIYGKMTLTNYVMQNLLGLLIFSGFGLGLAAYKLSYGSYMLIALIIYVVQIFLSRWWLSRYSYGPLEWLWRQLSYQKKLPLKIIKPHEGMKQM